MRLIFTLLFFTFISSSLIAQFSQQTEAAFIENKGQVVDQNEKANIKVLYVLPLKGMNVQLTKNGFGYDTYIPDEKQSLSYRKSGRKSFFDRLTKSEKKQIPTFFKFHRVDIEFEGANPNPQITAGDACSDYFNYITVTNETVHVKRYKKLVYKNLYNGIDLELIAGIKHDIPFEYNFIVHPGADLEQIRIKYNGAFSYKLSAKNSILLELAHGILEEKIPLSYEAGTGKKVKVRYIQKEQSTFGFKSTKYNRNNILIIDPTPERTWATYYGGEGTEFFNNDFATSLARDASGNIYICGSTSSATNIATAGSHQATVGNIDAYLAKFNSSGVRQWATYYGGASTEYGNSVAVDGSGSIIIGGYSESNTAIATAGTHQTTLNGVADGFIVKFNTNGVRQWGTYYGGSDEEIITNVTASGTDIYFTGITYSPDGIATAGAHQTTYGGAAEQDAFVGRLNTSGVRQWGTYYGGTGFDGLYCVAVDGSQNVYVTGESNSTNNIASAGAHQTTLFDIEDGVLVRFNSSGVRQWGTYCGGDGADIFISVATDATGNVYVTGATESTNGIATAGSHQPALSLGGAFDGVITKFNSSGVRQWGTYFGGLSVEGFTSVQIASDASVYLAGLTTGSSGLATSGAFQTNYGGGISDGLFAKFNTNGVRQWCTLYGGSGEDVTTAINVSSGNVFHVAGYTNSTSTISTAGSHQVAYGGDPVAIDEFDAFLGRFTDVITSVSQLSRANGINIYPNPAAAEFTIKFNSNNTPSFIAMYDVAGKLVKSEPVFIGFNAPLKIRTSGLQTGTYLLKIWNNKQQLIASEQVVISK